MFRYLPEQASDFADRVDWLHNWITDISLFFTVAIFGAAVYFAIRYRKSARQGKKIPRITGEHRLEIIWTVVPTIIIIFVAVNGFLIYREMRTVPKDALDIQVTAKSWDWTFEYPNGKKSFGEFVIPVDKPVKLIMRSKDVLHSLFIPAMRVKNDVLPTMFTYLWFRPIKTGSYDVFCTEFCGENHWNMLAKAHVVSSAEYERWLADTSEEYMKSRISPARLGQKLYIERKCNSCHSLTGLKIIGPSFKDLWGKNEELESGMTVTVDENYIEKSLLNPNADIVKGYPPSMPSLEGQLTPDEIAAISAFIKDLDKILAEDAASGKSTIAVPVAVDLTKMSPEDRGKHYYEAKLCQGCHSLDGSPSPGPTFKALFGKKGSFEDGATYVADEDYLKSSILNGPLQIVKGYQNLMPKFEGQLKDEEVQDLIAFIKTVK